jgi:hypothetical protein
LVSHAFKVEGNPAEVNEEVALERQAEHWRHPLLKELVAEACVSLSLLDADRLEELALSCKALNREVAGLEGDARLMLANQAREAEKDMAVLARVLEATRTNLDVLYRLRERRAGQLEYRASPLPEWRCMESGHGDN